MASLLLIEDDPGIRAAVIRALADRGHVVRSAPNAMSGLQEAVASTPDLVILDLGLPDLDGVELLRMLRAVSKVPVIVATARDEDAQVVRALDAGADDYVKKPYSAAQLDARIRAVLRRSLPDEAPKTYTIRTHRRSQIARRHDRRRVTGTFSPRIRSVGLFGRQAR
jgi:two-component system KDP operon response regulator KdpE